MEWTLDQLKQVVGGLYLEIVGLRSENARLRDENATLKEQAKPTEQPDEITNRKKRPSPIGDINTA